MSSTLARGPGVCAVERTALFILLAALMGLVEMSETHRVVVTVRYSKACARGRPGWLRWVLGMNGLNVPGWGTAARPDWLNHYWSLKRLSLWSPTAGQQPGGAGPS